MFVLKFYINPLKEIYKPSIVNKRTFSFVVADGSRLMITSLEAV